MSWKMREHFVLRSIARRGTTRTRKPARGRPEWASSSVIRATTPCSTRVWPSRSNVATAGRPSATRSRSPSGEPLTMKSKRHARESPSLPLKACTSTGLSTPSRSSWNGEFIVLRSCARESFGALHPGRYTLGSSWRHAPCPGSTSSTGGTGRRRFRASPIADNEDLSVMVARLRAGAARGRLLRQPGGCSVVPREDRMLGRRSGALGRDAYRTRDMRARPPGFRAREAA